jgi:hypothetical protein
MADDIKDVLNTINPSIKAKVPKEELEGDRKFIEIETEAKVKNFPSRELAGKLKVAFAEASGKDEKDPKYKRYNVSDVTISEGKDGNAIIKITTASKVVIDPELLAIELQVPNTKKLLQGMASGGQAKDEVQNGKTTPAAPVKVGQVGQGSQFALKVGEKNEETIRGNADYKIMQDKEGKLTAMVDLGYGTPQLLKSTDTVKQQITATIDGVDGKPPKKMTFDVGKDGALTEVKAPAATPKGNEKSAEPMR